MFGVTTPCVQQIAAELSKEWECLVFHATVSAGNRWRSWSIPACSRAPSTHDHGSVRSADGRGVSRDAGSFRRVHPYPLAVCWSVGALDMVNFGAKDTVPLAYAGRRLQIHNPQVTLMRTPGGK